MEQRLVFEKARFVEHLKWVDDEEELDLMEDRLNEEDAWEIAFQRGVQQANDEMIDDWYEDDE